MFHVKITLTDDTKATGLEFCGAWSVPVGTAEITRLQEEARRYYGYRNDTAIVQKLCDIVQKGVLDGLSLDKF